MGKTLGVVQEFYAFPHDVVRCQYSHRGVRDIKEDFFVNIIDVSEYSPWLFAKIDSVVTLIILVVFGLMVFVKEI